jgi:two-component system nitrate/nitrite response regulator NarL
MGSASALGDGMRTEVDAEALVPALLLRHVRESHRESSDVVRSPLPAGDHVFRVIVGDHYPIVLEGLARVLGHEPAIQIVDRCTTAAAIVDAAAHHRPALAILDAGLVAPDGFALLRDLRTAGISIPIVLVSAGLDDEQVLQAVRFGIRGLVMKSAPVESVLSCVRTVLRGGSCLDPSLVGRAMAALLTREAALRELARLLTGRELEVVQLVMAGLNNKEIAGRLFVSTGTLKVHLHRIYAKLGVASRQELIALARRKGL